MRHSLIKIQNITSIHVPLRAVADDPRADDFSCFDQYFPIFVRLYLVTKKKII